MHKYQPRIHIAKKRDQNHASNGGSGSGSGSGGANGAPLVDVVELGSDFKTFVFPETIFIAVTAYQNQLVSTKA